MTQLSPTALEAAAKHFDPDAFAKDQHGYLMIRGESRRKRAKQAATAAITDYLAQAEKERWVMVPARTVTDAKRYHWLRDGNSYAPEEQDVRGGDELDALCDEYIAAAQNGGE